MREILFRGKRFDNGEWTQGSIVIANDRLNNGETYILATAADFSYGDEGNEKMTDKEAMNWFENRMTSTSMPGAREMFALAASALRERIAGGWISVKDRLPEKQSPCLCYYKFEQSDDSHFIGVLDWLVYYEEHPHWQHESTGIVVTHWQPLPEPPQEEDV